MKVVNDNNIGNPYHDEEGKFTTPDGVGSGGPSTPSSGGDYTDDDLLGLYDEIFSDDIEENEELQKLFGEHIETEQPQENKLKSIGKMSQEELLMEIGQRLNNLTKKNIHVSKDFFSNDLKLKCACLRQIDTVIEKYGITNFVNNNLKISNDDSIETASLIRSYWDDESNTYETGEIVFNPNMMNDFDSVIDDIKSDQEDRFNSLVDELFYPEVIACHEMGHLLAGNIFSNMLKNGTSLSKYKRILSMTGERISTQFCYEFKEEILAIYVKQNPGLGEKDFENETCQYGTYNENEWFAETFLSMNGGKPTKAALAMKEWLQNKFEFKGE